MPAYINQVFICNLALDQIGAKPITSFTENSKSARKCVQFYEQALWTTLEKFPWAFSRAKKVLVQDASYTDLEEKYDYAYTIPNDCVRPWRLVSGSAWEREQDLILTNDDEAILKYATLIEDPTKYTPLFAEGMAGVLASKIAVPLAAKVDPASLLQAAVVIMEEAMLTDGDQEELDQGEYTKHTEDTEPWLVARS